MLNGSFVSNATATAVPLEHRFPDGTHLDGIYPYVEAKEPVPRRVFSEDGKVSATNKLE